MFIFLFKPAVISPFMLLTLLAFNSLKYILPEAESLLFLKLKSLSLKQSMKTCFFDTTNVKESKVLYLRRRLFW